MKWFRLYTDVLEDPKVQKLSPELFKFWINILCLTSKHEGRIPPLDDVSFALRLPLHETEEAFHALKIAHLISPMSNQHGEGWAPHNWKKRQYKSDTSTQRVKRFRNAQRNNIETAPDTETDTDTKQRKKHKEKTALPPWLDSELWEDYLDMRKKLKAAPTEKAKKLLISKLDKLKSEGQDPDEILKQSIENSWKGLFEVKHGKQFSNTNRQPTVHENFTAGIALALAEFDEQQ